MTDAKRQGRLQSIEVLEDLAEFLPFLVIDLLPWRQDGVVLEHALHLRLAGAGVGDDRFDAVDGNKIVDVSAGIVFGQFVVGRPWIRHRDDDPTRNLFLEVSKFVFQHIRLERHYHPVKTFGSSR